jgi:hypothetical protein
MLKKSINAPITTLLLSLLGTPLGIQNVRADYCNCQLSRIGKDGQSINKNTWAWTPFGCNVYASMQSDGPWESCCC